MNSEINAALDTRYEMSAEELTRVILSNFSDSTLKLRQLKPFIEEIRRRFKHRPRKIGVDGKYTLVAGHKTFKSWCDGVLHRTDRAVHYMIKKASGDKKKESKTESISVISERVKKYIQNQVDKFEGSERDELLKHIEGVLRNLSKHEAVS